MDLFKIAKNWKNAANSERKYLQQCIVKILPKYYQDNFEIDQILEEKNNKYQVQICSECSVYIDEKSQLVFLQWPCECGPNGCDEDDFGFFK